MIQNHTAVDKPTCDSCKAQIEIFEDLDIDGDDKVEDWEGDKT